jgi:regulator of protease activity HflC (stomatin/prohibitin superfamily)
MKSAGIGVGLIALVVALVWAGSGFFIVQEGQQAVVSTFGKYSYTSDAGFQWRFPFPFQSHETVPVTQLRSREIGRNNVIQATGLRDSSMLTQDENIVDIRFTVQYRLKDARAYIFENRDPDSAVEQAAESAVREIVGRSKVDRCCTNSATRSQRPGEVGSGPTRPAQGRHPDRQRQRAERSGARAGAGRLQRRLQGRCRPRPLQE